MVRITASVSLNFNFLFKKLTMGNPINEIVAATKI